MRPGLRSLITVAIRDSVAGASITDGGFEGFTTNIARTVGSASLSISESGNCHVGSSFWSTAPARKVTTSSPVAFETRQLEIWRELRNHQRDAIARTQEQVVGKRI